MIIQRQVRVFVSQGARTSRCQGKVVPHRAHLGSGQFRHQKIREYLDVISLLALNASVVQTSCSGRASPCAQRNTRHVFPVHHVISKQGPARQRCVYIRSHHPFLRIGERMTKEFTASAIFTMKMVEIIEVKVILQERFFFLELRRRSDANSHTSGSTGALINRVVHVSVILQRQIPARCAENTGGSAGAIHRQDGERFRHHAEAHASCSSFFIKRVADIPVVELC